MPAINHLMGIILITGAIEAAPLPAPQDNGTTPQSADSLETYIDSLIYAGDFGAAQIMLDSALAQYPLHIGLRESVGLLEILQGFEGLDTLDIYDEYLFDSEADALEERVDGLIAMGRLETAAAELAYARVQHPKHDGLRQSQEWLEYEMAQRGFLKTSDDPFLLVFIGTAVLFVLIIGLILFFIKRRPLISAGIYISCFYIFILTSIIILYVYVYESINPTEKLTTLGPKDIMYQHGMLITMTCFLGALGGTIMSTVTLAKKESHPIPESGKFAFFFFKPINGFFLAGVMYVALLSGYGLVFSGTNSGNSSIPSVFSVALLALLTGMFSDDAIEKLKSIFKPEGDAPSPEEQVDSAIGE